MGSSLSLFSSEDYSTLSVASAAAAAASTNDNGNVIDLMAPGEASTDEEEIVADERISAHNDDADHPFEDSRQETRQVERKESEERDLHQHHQVLKDKDYNEDTAQEDDDDEGNHNEDNNEDEDDDDEGNHNEDNNEDEDEDEHSIVCCCCDQAFETDLERLACEENRLPFTCSECFECTCCYKCLRQCYEEHNNTSFEQSQHQQHQTHNTEVTCPECFRPGFDIRRLFPNRSVCRLLEVINTNKKRKKEEEQELLLQQQQEEETNVECRSQSSTDTSHHAAKMPARSACTAAGGFDKDYPSQGPADVPLRTNVDASAILAATAKYKIGMPVQKVFNSRVYPGEVESVRFIPLYSIRYENGSEEELPEDQVAPRMVVSYTKTTPTAADYKDEKKPCKPDSYESRNMPEADTTVAVEDVLPAEDLKFVRVPPSDMDFSISSDQSAADVDNDDEWIPPSKHKKRKPQTLFSTQNKLYGVKRQKLVVPDAAPSSSGQDCKPAGTEPNTQKDINPPVVMKPFGLKQTAWMNELDRRFEDKRSVLPASLTDVCRLMDTLSLFPPGSSEKKEGVFMERYARDRITRKALLKWLRIHHRNNPDDPGVSWHRDQSEWAPDSIESLKAFIGLLLQWEGNDWRPVSNSTVGALLQSKIYRLPRTYRQVLRLMTALLDDGVDYEKVLGTKAGINSLSKWSQNHPGCEGISWHRKGGEWCPSNKRDLEVFMEFLRNHHRRRSKWRRSQRDVAV